MDLSLAVEACYRNLGDRENVTVVQADIFNPPFEPESFDVIVSIGVLHHTPDPRQAFRSLVGLLKPGGLIGIWVYHAYHDDTLRMKLSQFYRRWTRRMPLRVLYALCHLAIPWYYLNRTPLIRTISGRLWHISDHPLWSWRVLDTFDWYSCWYQSHHTYPEVFRWFQENGLERVQPYDPPIAMVGLKSR
jgi:SAM-dependent methyltransferase